MVRHATHEPQGPALSASGTPVASGGTARSGVPEIGSAAPDLGLRDQHGQDVALEDFAGSRALLLVFFPFAFSGICTGELRDVQDDIEAFANERVQVVGISCDPAHSLRAWADTEGYRFPLLSDFWPHGEVSRSYGVFLDDKGFATRGTFLVDLDGIVRWRLVHGPGEARDPATYREALAAM